MNNFYHVVGKATIYFGFFATVCIGLGVGVRDCNQTLEAKKQKNYTEGKQVALEGLKQDVCPYQGSDKQTWNLGYMDGIMELKGLK